jgi:hypothetical protein
MAPSPTLHRQYSVLIQYGLLQTAKECKIHLDHFKAHRDTAARLQASLREDSGLEKLLLQKQLVLGEQAEQ